MDRNVIDNRSSLDHRQRHTKQEYDRGFQYIYTYSWDPLDQRVRAENRADIALANKVNQALRSHPLLFSQEITVSANNGFVVLRGEVPNPKRSLVVRTARNVSGVSWVVDQMEER